jgi:hypothetical protein
MMLWKYTSSAPYAFRAWRATASLLRIL